MIDRIRDWPTTLKPEEVKKDLKENPGTAGWHESLLRSYHIVQKVKWLLAEGTSPEVTLQLIEDMEKGGAN